MRTMTDEITASEMRRIDVNCKGIGLIPLQLMENAGACVARAVRARFGKEHSVAIFAGTGNNGGDAFVAARHLLDYHPKILLFGRARDIATDEARQNWQILQNLGADLREIRDSSELRTPNLNHETDTVADVIIDAMLGTGVRGGIREPIASAINLINASGAFVISVDVPSGFGSGPDHPDYSDFEKSVHADLTVTAHRAKVGLSECPEITGEVEIGDIGIPARAEQVVGIGDLPPGRDRSARSHKGDNGRVLVIGGGAFTGAPALTALAALRTGADWVTVAAPRNAAGVIAGFSPNLIVHALSGAGSHLVHDDIDAINALIPKHDVVVIGMGLGRERETAETVAEIIRSNHEARFVIDADALHAIPTLIPLPLPTRTVPLILTPHTSEFQSLGKTTSTVPTVPTVPTDIDERSEVVRDFSLKNRVVTLLKGPADIISDGDVVRINRTGNAGMTVGGTGDVLAGVIGALFAKHDALASASAGAFVTGTAGDLASSEFGFGLLATDVIRRIPDAMQRDGTSLA